MYVCMSDMFTMVRIVLGDLFQVLLMLGLMWLNVSPTTITKLSSKLLNILYQSFFYVIVLMPILF